MSTIQTERLTIRPITSSDAEFLFELMNTPKWHQFIGDRKILSIQDASDYMESKMHADIKVKGFVNHVIEETSSSTQLGTCSLHDREWVAGMDVGYALLPQYEGKGYAKEAAAAMVQLAFDKYEQLSISAVTDDDNFASQKLLRSLGFEPNGTIAMENDDTLCLFKLTKENFKKP